MSDCPEASQFGRSPDLWIPDTKAGHIIENFKKFKVIWSKKCEKVSSSDVTGLERLCCEVCPPKEIHAEGSGFRCDITT